MIPASLLAAGCVAASVSPDLDVLLAEYRAVGLPLPPADAKLVRFWGGGQTEIDGKWRSVPDHIAFLVRPGTAGSPPVLLCGADEVRSYHDGRPREIPPDPGLVRDLGVCGDDLLMAAQCHARGWDKLAKHLAGRGSDGDTSPPSVRLVRAAWEYWRGQLGRPDGDRGPVAKRLHALFDRNRALDTKNDPALNRTDDRHPRIAAGNFGVDIEDNRTLLRDLDLTLMPGKGPPGTAEALIDDLVNLHADPFYGNQSDFTDERYWRIARLGFDAVPALIDHLDDDRLTRVRETGGSNLWLWDCQLRVGHVVSRLLTGLAGLPVGGEGPTRRSHPIAWAAAQKWWVAASAVGERRYALDHVLDGGVNDHLLSVLLAKYPRHIPGLYRTLPDTRPELVDGGPPTPDSGPLARAVARCPLSAPEKLAVLLPGARHKDPGHRRSALAAIAAVDPPRFVTLWLAGIENPGEDLGGLAGLAAEFNDPRVWSALEKVVRRSGPGVRLAVMETVCGPDDARCRRPRVRLLLAFLDDSTVWDPKAAGRPVGRFDRTEVRDRAATCLAFLLRVPIPPVGDDTTAAEWAETRAAVRAAAERELAKPD